MFELLICIVIIVAIWFGSALFLGIKWATAMVIAAIAIVIIRGISKSEAKKNVIRTLKSPNSSNPLFNTDFDELDGHSFESYCADLLLANDYAEIEITPGSGDKGIDLLAVKDGKKYGIQCKRYSGAVGIKAVQEALSGSVYYQCDQAVVMTNSSFTQAAVDMANRVSVELWDRSHVEMLLSNLLEKNQADNIEDSIDNKNEKDESKQRKKPLSKDAKQLLVAVIAVALIFAAIVLIDNTSDPRDDMYYNDYDEEYDYDYDYDEMD